MSWHNSSEENPYLLLQMRLMGSLWAPHPQRSQPGLHMPDTLQLDQNCNWSCWDIDHWQNHRHRLPALPCVHLQQGWYVLASIGFCHWLAIWGSWEQVCQRHMSWSPSDFAAVFRMLCLYFVQLCWGPVPWVWVKFCFFVQWVQSTSVYPPLSLTNMLETTVMPEGQ